MQNIGFHITKFIDSATKPLMKTSRAFSHPLLPTRSVPSSNTEGHTIDYAARKFAIASNSLECPPKRARPETKSPLFPYIRPNDERKRKTQRFVLLATAEKDTALAAEENDAARAANSDSTAILGPAPRAASQLAPPSVLGNIPRIQVKYTSGAARIGTYPQGGIAALSSIAVPSVCLFNYCQITCRPRWSVTCRCCRAHCNHAGVRSAEHCRYR
jgi:hypothetical protein